jgi:valyl-tRNA synthetase
MTDHAAEPITEPTDPQARAGTDQSVAEMASAYDALATERRLYETWLDRGYFRADPNPDREPYCIVLPPPNVTGALHMGHAFQQLLQDIIIRRARMQGLEALWLPGTDHAGIATQVVVERELAAQGLGRGLLGREAFVERVWEWKARYGDRIVEQMKAMGNSCDWSRLRFTMDEGLARAVRVAFVRLYDEGLIYRGDRLVNWCPRDTTSLSDSEVVHTEIEGELVTFAYPLSDGGGEIDVATTRVETMLGDAAVAVHPDDERYTALVGRAVRHPFTREDLPIIADEAVDPSFGTGAVKVTPAHDQADFEIGRRHGLTLRNILTADAHISDAASEEFRGLDRHEARGRVLRALEERGLVRNIERPFLHAVGHCYRCDTEIEPWPAGLQWFVKVGPLKGPAKDAAERGKITFWPARWKTQYVQWLDMLRDWNISRQLWWGHRIPVWYCPDGHETAAVEDPSACATCGSGQLEQDPDVLDTWFSSQLWPFSTLGWPEQTTDLSYFYPTTTLVTGYEILYLWVARMIMSGLFLTGEIPFHNVVINGLVRDPQGRKMSKSLGNVLDPMDIVQRVGADALRFGLAWQATEAQNIPFGDEHVDAGRRFANKMWNASRLVLGTRDGRTGAPELPDADALTLPARWLLSRHQAMLEEVDTALDRFRFAEAAQAAHRFFWYELCDWALEAEKERLYDGTPEGRRAASELLSWVLERTLRVLHPFIPFVTEEIWLRFDAGESIVIAPWPEQRPEHRDPESEARFEALQAIVTAIRRFRKAHDLRDRTELAATVRPADGRGADIQAVAPEIQRLANLSSLTVAGGPDARASDFATATLMADGAEITLSLHGILDPQAERRRLADRLESLESGASKHRAKLANDAFVSKAPADVVQKERDRLASLDEELAALREQLSQLS